MSPREPLFAGLVYNEKGEPAEATRVGQEPCYAIPDEGFMRHVEAHHIDRQVLAHVKEYALSMKEFIVENVMQTIGSDDPFTQAAIERSIETMDQQFDLEQEIPNIEELRVWLWMNGFRVRVDIHGQVLEVDLPGVEP